MKHATACKQCRQSKRKCWQHNAGGSCAQCRRSQIACSFAPDQHARGPQTSDALPNISGHLSVSDHLPVSDHLVQDLVERYIRCIHDRPHSLFHVPSLRAAVREKTLKPGLLYALLSFGARFHPDKDVSCLAGSYFEHSKQHLNKDIENICIQNMQTCVLLGNLSAASLRGQTEALYLGIAIRMAVILQFDRPASRDTILIQEQKRRIWWTLYVFDRWCSAGNDIDRNITDICRTVDLPFDETVFQGLDARLGLMTLSIRPSPGLWAYMVTLAQIFGSVQDINKQTTQTANLDQRIIDDAVVSLAANLDTWEADLPSDIKYNETNLLAHRERGCGGQFVSLHMGFYHYSTLLYYQYLDGERVTNPTTQRFAERCKALALEQSTMLKRGRELGKCEMLYPGVGHAAVVSSSVLLHTYLLGKEDEVTTAKTCLESNLEILKELRHYWPSIEMIVRRLTVFQDTCMKAAPTEAYRFGGQVVKFLLEYHRPL